VELRRVQIPGRRIDPVGVCISVDGTRLDALIAAE